MTDRYGQDVLSGDWKAPRKGRSAPLAAEMGVVVEDVETTAKTLPAFPQLWHEMLHGAPATQFDPFSLTL